MFNWIGNLESRSRPFLVAIAVTIVAAVGLVDYLINHEVTFSVFYLLAVGLATWFVGKGFGSFISLFSVAVSIAGDLAAGARFSTPLVPAWNGLILLAFYLIVVWLLSRLRTLQSELELRVKERTSALIGEIAERERLERELLEISEREQRRIGQDLHDSLCQHLAGTSLAGQVLEEKLRSNGRAERDDATRIVGLIEEGISMARKLAKGLHPIELGSAGLMESLESLALATSDLFKVTCRFECDSPVLIHNPSTSGHLYRIAQEAISNAIKHGKAKRITLRLDSLDEGITLTIRDDGTGLPEMLPAAPGMGLRIMAHRAGMIGSSFQIARNSEGGTSVTCHLRSDSSGNGANG
jgi:signal transduction histidine kinase